MFLSTKVIELGSTCFRQPFAKSHCRFLHGYNLIAKFIFESTELDNNNWVVDFGSFGVLKQTLRNTFDHKTIISKKDPYLKEFKTMHKQGIIDLVEMEDVSIEMFSKYCFDKANFFLPQNIKCNSAEVYEHSKNSAVFKY